MSKDKNGIPDWYQIKYRPRNEFGIGEGAWRYGIVDQYSDDAKRLWKSGELVVEDAVLPKRWRLIVQSFEIRPLRITIHGEYDKFVEREYKKAYAHSKRTRCLVGKLFTIGVGDGCAFYVVTAVKKNKAQVEWRSFQGDRWVDNRVYGYGGWFPKATVREDVRREDGMREIFGG